MKGKNTLGKVIKWINYYYLVPCSCCHHGSDVDIETNEGIPFPHSGKNNNSGTAFFFHLTSWFRFSSKKWEKLH